MIDRENYIVDEKEIVLYDREEFVEATYSPTSD